MLYKYVTFGCSSYHRSEHHVATVDPGQAKVGQLHLALTGHQDVLWLQVSMHHPIGVKERQTAQQLAHQVLQNTLLFQAEHCDSKTDHLSRQTLFQRVLTLIRPGGNPGAGAFSRYVFRSWSTCSKTRVTLVSCSDLWVAHTSMSLPRHNNTGGFCERRRNRLLSNQTGKQSHRTTLGWSNCSSLRSRATSLTVETGRPF